MEIYEIVKEGALISKIPEVKSEETKTEVKSLFFGTNEKLNLNTLESPKIDKKTDISLLYKAAKEFIYYVKGIKEA